MNNKKYCEDCISFGLCFSRNNCNWSAMRPCPFYKDKKKCIDLVCNIGDIIYTIDYDAPTNIVETIVKQIRIRNKGIFIIGGKCSYDDWGMARYEFEMKDLGKSYFLTREEAEANKAWEKK